MLELKAKFESLSEDPDTETDDTKEESEEIGLVEDDEEDEEVE